MNMNYIRNLKQEATSQDYKHSGLYARACGPTEKSKADKTKKCPELKDNLLVKSATSLVLEEC